MMKRLIFATIVMALVILPCLAQNADKEVERTQEFTKAVVMKSGQEKVNALKAYIQKFPETSSKWTVLAHYNLATEYYQIGDFASAAQEGEKTLKMSLGDAERGRLLLVVANSYGVKKSPVFNQEKALDYANKAVSFAESKGLNDVLEGAKNLKNMLIPQAPKGPKMTPEQEIKFKFTSGDYAGVISFYQGLSGGDKANEEIHKVYANALEKTNRVDQALAEYQSIYSRSKKGAIATEIAKIHEDKAKRTKQYDSAVDSYLEAYLLFGKEGNSSNAKISYDRAKFLLIEKYGLTERIKKYNASLGNQENASKKNETAILALEREYRKEERRIRKQYGEDIEPPAYEKENLKKIQKKIDALKSGAPAGAAAPSDEGKKIEEAQAKIKSELDTRVAAAKKRLGM